MCFHEESVQRAIRFVALVLGSKIDRAGNCALWTAGGGHDGHVCSPYATVTVREAFGATFFTFGGSATFRSFSVVVVTTRADGVSTMFVARGTTPVRWTFRVGFAAS